MEHIARFIVKQRKKIGLCFLIMLIISLILLPRVKINYDLSEYIPDSERAKRGMNVLEEEFAMQGYARIMINNVSLIEAKEYKDKIASVDGVDIVLWLDDSVDVYRPTEFISEDTLRDYYKDGSALIEVMFEESEYSSKTNKAIDEIKKIIPEDSNMIGSAVDTKSAQDTVQSEIGNIMIMVVPVVLVILILTTDSYVSPIIFLTVIGMSIMLNMGTNVIFKHVSFLTYSLVAALQLAVSMDYSVFMLHQFEAQDKTDLEEAMVKTISSAALSIMSSALTTIAGFVALVFMGFTIGADMGLVFAKGIVLSLFCVIFFMPYLILKYYPLIKKTTHKKLLPNFDKFARFTSRFSYIIIAICLLIILPSYVAQKQNVFLYGSASFGGGEGTKVYEDEKQIVAKFGRSNPIIILVPTGDYISEKEMAKEYEDLEIVKKVQSLANLVGEGVPDSFVPIDNYEKFRTEKYSRFVIYLRTSSESDLAFESCNKIEEITQKYYADNYEITGVIPITMNIKDVVTADYNVVNLLSIASVMIILLFTFKSVAIPIILIVVIESGIFINMAIPYFSGNSMMFLGYLIVSSIQLGATIDYAILMTNNYLDARQYRYKYSASRIATNKSVVAIITSGGILTCAGYLIKWGSTINAISELGGLVGRGAIMSMALVIFALPHILEIFDGVIRKTEFDYIKKSFNKDERAARKRRKAKLKHVHEKRRRIKRKEIKSKIKYRLNSRMTALKKRPRELKNRIEKIRKARKELLSNIGKKNIKTNNIKEKTNKTNGSEKKKGSKKNEKVNR